MGENQIMKVGDVVKLKCGGPSMVITMMDEKEFVQCTWFDGQHCLEGSFPQAALVPDKR